MVNYRIGKCIGSGSYGKVLLVKDYSNNSYAMLTEAVTVNSHEEVFDDVGCNADLYASRQDAFQGSSSHERSQQQNYY